MWSRDTPSPWFIPMTWEWYDASQRTQTWKFCNFAPTDHYIWHRTPVKQTPREWLKYTALSGNGCSFCNSLCNAFYSPAMSNYWLSQGLKSGWQSRSSHVENLCHIASLLSQTKYRLPSLKSVDWTLNSARTQNSRTWVALVSTALGGLTV